MTSMATALPAQTPEPVTYTVRFPDAKNNYAEVEARVPAGGAKSVELFMPVWTPGSYLVREYARNVEDLRAVSPDGKTLPVAKSRKNRWQIETGGAEQVRLQYRVYCHEMSVRTNWVESDFALLNGAPTFVTLVGGEKRRHDVTLELPAGWKSSISGMDETSPNHFTAPDYDTLVDSPIAAGNPDIQRFEVDGIPHFLVNQGGGELWDGQKSAADVKKIVERFRKMWGSLPYRKYVFLNMITESGGGLEHKSSMTVMTNRWAMRTPRAYTSWLGLIGHEFFHAWNVKRMRPVELGPFDYEAENHTRSLWIAEGFTEYFGPLTVVRAGLSTPADWLGGNGNGAPGFSGLINELQTTPGRTVQAVEESSYDAWIKYYRPDENSNNTSVSYYTKGAIVGWLLDARIRHVTKGEKSLDDVMRLAFARYAGEHGYTTEQFKSVASEVAGQSLADFFRRTTESTGELDYSEALDWFGLRFKPAPAANGNAPKKGWIGVQTRVDAGRLLVSEVPRATPAYSAGLNVGDEILAIGDYRVRAEQLSVRLDNYRPGDKVSMLVARREKLMRIELTLGEEPPRLWQLEVRPDATKEQKAHFESWMR
jgi:predicted metalloprotease with PDZ domain